MPELPEVETILQALKPHLLNDKFTSIHTYIDKLRTPLDLSDQPELINQIIINLRRRAKYTILELKNGFGLIIHLGMTGSWRLESPSIERQKHDHVEFNLFSGLVLRYNDPRRFGQIVLFNPGDTIHNHKLLVNLGPEPLLEGFNANYLKKRCHKKKMPTKPLIMDNKVVVGVGNIYASESLFRAGISPLKPAGSLSKVRLERLVESIKVVLTAAIDAGGTTIRDYTRLNGEEGYFSRSLMVYGRSGEICFGCKRGIIRKVNQAGRSTYYCPVCQR